MAKQHPTPPQHPVAAHDFKGLADWIEVFRAGDHVDSKGQACSFGTADLDQMVANVSLGKPPAVLGHPKHNDPAYAWGELRRDGEKLFAKFTDINPAFAAGVETGAYRNRSVSLLKDKDHGWRVRHIGWLGAAPPAIDGLQPLDLSAAEGELHEFSGGDMTTSWALGDVASLLRGLRDWVIEKDGIDTANKVLPDWSITSVANAAVRLREQELAEQPAFTSPTPTPTGGLMSFTQADLQRAADEAAARITTELTAQFAAQQTELTTLRTERQAERIAAQITGWKAGGLLAPAEEAGLAEFMAALENAPTEFSFTAAGASAPSKLAPAAYFAAFVAARKPLLNMRSGPVLNPADPAAPGSALSDKEVANRAHEYRARLEKNGHVITMGAAIDAVLAGNDKE